MCPKNDILPEDMTFYQDKQIATCISVNLVCILNKEKKTFEAYETLLTNC